MHIIYGVFVSQLIRYARVRKANILSFFQGIYFGFKVIKAGIFFTYTFRKFDGRHIVTRDVCHCGAGTARSFRNT